MSRDEDEAREVFSERYAIERAEVNRRVERQVIGGDWGANGYTTMAQADELGALVRLDASMRLLDLGAGRGWPGLYLAKTTGCSVVLVDLPLEGISTALRRARDEGLSERVAGVVASASHIPLRPDVVDAVVSCDVFC
jgi:cyclopropane fatty-acyl-phospholipid synthase-like methyltransferase